MTALQRQLLASGSEKHIPPNCINFPFWVWGLRCRTCPHLGVDFNLCLQALEKLYTYISSPLYGTAGTSRAKVNSGLARVVIITQGLKIRIFARNDVLRQELRQGAS